MTNLFRKQQGAATLIITIIALFTITLIVLFAGNFGVMQQKTTTNLYNSNQAYEAAEAGLEFAIPYLQKNQSTILANKSGGYLSPPYSDSSTTNVTLANGSQYSIVYSNPTANNYNLIKITVTGTSAGGAATRTISQLVQYGGNLNTVPTSTLVSQGTVNLSGNTSIVNKETNSTIVSGTGVTLSGASATTTSTGGSNKDNMGGDITQNNSALNTTTPSDLFANYFGVSSTVFKNNVTNYYSNSSDTNYSSTFNGMTGNIIWIDQTGGNAVINGNVTIGSPTNPVILIVNGNLYLSGTPTIYGLIYEMGGATQTDVLGNVALNGGLITSGTLNVSGSTTITYSSSILNVLKDSNGYFAKVPGSWKDF